MRRSTRPVRLRASVARPPHGADRARVIWYGQDAGKQISAEFRACPPSLKLDASHAKRAERAMHLPRRSVKMPNGPVPLNQVPSGARLGRPDGASPLPRILGQGVTCTYNLAKAAAAVCRMTLLQPEPRRLPLLRRPIWRKSGRRGRPLHPPGLLVREADKPRNTCPHSRP